MAARHDALEALLVEDRLLGQRVERGDRLHCIARLQRAEACVSEQAEAVRSVAGGWCAVGE
eukprot:212634-Rhodomonas_salina.1